MNKLQGHFKEFFDYFLFGIGTVLINFGLFFALNEFVGLHYLFANLIAITLAVLFSFWVNKRYVFRTRPQTKWGVLREFLLFLGLRASAGVLDMGGLFLLVRFMRLGANLSKVIIELLIASCNYLFSKFIIFKKETLPSDQDGEKE